ncbi:MAG: PAS domain-containing protein [Deltaproteobacteria bacterium]|nr:PAS domain-containing protein [Deltaproteobacteria bacterium]
MTTNHPPNNKQLNKLPLNIAIVGGGRACKFFLDLLRTDYFAYLSINVLGVCDIDPEASGLQRAREMGIFTTDNFKDLFEFEHLDSILELTNSRDVLLELVKLRPKGVGVVEHNTGRFFRSFYELNQRLQSAEHQANVEKLFSNFMVQQSTAAIVVINTDFTIHDVNEVYLKVVGKKKEAVLGTRCHEAFYGLSAPCSSSNFQMRCPMLETMQTGKSAHVIHEFPGIMNQKSYGNIVTYPFKNENGDVFRVMELIRDITEEISLKWEKRAEELRADLNKMIQEDRMISLGKLAASCVHEINNPIQGLLTFSDLMQNILSEETLTPGDTENFKKFLTMMSSELERCGHIVSGLLSFSRQIPLEYKKLDLNEIMDAVLRLSRHKMELQNIELITQLQPGVIAIHGDANRLQQVLLNLIFNAIEAMPDGGQLKIVSEMAPSENQVEIKIADNGTGIPEKQVSHIFDPFFTTKKEGEGTGLGLSIVYGVVRNHGGKVSVQSKEGEGTVFTLVFPVIEQEGGSL